MTKFEFLQHAKVYLDDINNKISCLHHKLDTNNNYQYQSITEELDKYQQKKSTLDMIDLKIRILKDSEWEVNKPNYLRMIDLNSF